MPIADSLNAPCRTKERTDKKGGEVTALKRVMSQDGKTMTVTTKGTSPPGAGNKQRDRLREAIDGWPNVG
jgi:hypothetical protein